MFLFNDTATTEIYTLSLHDALPIFGYSGLAYATSHVKVVPVSTAGAAPVIPTVESASDKSYPIARPLFMYTAGPPEGAVKEYMDWILSDEGQGILLRKGYAPVRGMK